jgi:hypothetical protein
MFHVKHFVGAIFGAFWLSQKLRTGGSGYYRAAASFLSW